LEAFSEEELPVRLSPALEALTEKLIETYRDLELRT